MKNLLNSLTNRTKRMSVADETDSAWSRHPGEADVTEHHDRVSSLINSSRRRSEPLLRSQTRGLALIATRIQEDCWEAGSQGQSEEADCHQRGTGGENLRPGLSDVRRASCPESLGDPRSLATTTHRGFLERKNTLQRKCELPEKPVISSPIEENLSDDADEKIDSPNRLAASPGTDTFGGKSVYSRSTSLLNMRFTDRRPSKLGAGKPRKSSLPIMTSLSDAMEPVKKVLTGSHSLHRRKKSYECQKRAMEMGDPLSGRDASQQAKDFKLDREVVPWDASLDSDFSFAKNVWYYGELEVVHGYRRNLCQKYSAEDFRGYMVARIDGSGDIAYTITYRAGEELFVGEIPYHEGKYCLDFSDPDKPKFSCVRYLIADMIQGKFLQRVTFNWLLDHLVI